MATVEKLIYELKLLETNLDSNKNHVFHFKIYQQLIVRFFFPYPNKPIQMPSVRKYLNFLRSDIIYNER